MNIDIERLKHDREYWDSVAPEAATHYREDSTSVRWYLIAGNTRFYFSAIPGVGWIQSGSKGGVFIPRPAKQWSGDGLPPVGVECEVCGEVYGSCGDMKWKKVTVHAHVDGRVLAESTSHAGTYVLYTQAECRPLKSEKDRVVETAMGVCREMLFNESYAKQYAEALYEAGLLKMPESE